MGYDFDGFVAKLATFQAWQREVPALRVCRLDFGLGLLPGETVAGFGATTLECGAKLAREGMVVFVSAAEFGDNSGSSALIFEGSGVTRVGDANEGLRLLGVRRSVGEDEFDSLGLGRNTARWHGEAAIGLAGTFEEQRDLLERDPAEAVRVRAAVALVLHGGRAVPVLTEAFRRDAEAGVRRTAAWGLGQLGEAGTRALLELLPRAAPNMQPTFLSDRGIVLQSLPLDDGLLPGAAVALVMPLLADAGLQLDAVRVLGAMGPRAAAAVPAIQAIVAARGADHLRAAAVAALAAIAPGAPLGPRQERDSDLEALMSRLRSEASSYDEVMEGADEARPPWRLDRAAMAVCTELEELRDGRTTPEYGVPRLRRRHDELRALITATPGEYRFSRDVETIARFILDGDGPREDGK